MYKLRLENRFSYNSPVVVRSLGERYSIIQNKDSVLYKELSELFFGELDDDSNYLFIGEYVKSGRYKMKEIIPIDKDLDNACILLGNDRIFNKL